MIKCMMMCPTGQDLHPQYGCKCVDQSVIDALYDHGLDENCQLPVGNPSEQVYPEEQVFCIQSMCPDGSPRDPITCLCPGE